MYVDIGDTYIAISMHGRPYCTCMQIIGIAIIIGIYKYCKTD